MTLCGKAPKFFYIILSDPTSGAILGDNDRVTITIENSTPSGGGGDEGWCFISTLLAGKNEEVK